MPSSGEGDGSDCSIFSLVVVGGQERMSLTDMSAISLARCLSLAQNGAEHRRTVHAGWKTVDMRALSHSAERTPGKHRTLKNGI